MTAENLWPFGSIVVCSMSFNEAAADDRGKPPARRPSARMNRLLQ